MVVHGDLHYANVMADAAGQWRAIDPKPMAGDRHYEPAPMLWNRMDELAGPGAVGSVRDGLRRRFHALVDAGGLDEDRARDWVVVRMVVNAGWSVQDARRGRPRADRRRARLDHPLHRDHQGRAGLSRRCRPKAEIGSDGPSGQFGGFATTR